MHEELVPVITLDGPSGSGKGTVGRILAQRLGWHFLDSGTLYRLVALAAGRHAVALDDEAALVRLAVHLEARFLSDNIILAGEDVTDNLRNEACGNAASKVAVLPAVRLALLARQYAFRKPPGLVADGRDMGTVVFPDAALKIFLTASTEERARRRYKQWKNKGINASMTHLVSEIAERDARDAARDIAPMQPAPGAMILDTSGLGIEVVVERILEFWCKVSLDKQPIS